MVSKCTKAGDSVLVWKSQFDDNTPRLRGLLAAAAAAAAASPAAAAAAAAELQPQSLKHPPARHMLTWSKSCTMTMTRYAVQPHMHGNQTISRTSVFESDTVH